ncbi:hypothetical protein ACWD25_20030 [Streptomyces sp. NPDC002920]
MGDAAARDRGGARRGSRRCTRPQTDAGPVPAPPPRGPGRSIAGRRPPRRGRRSREGAAGAALPRPGCGPAPACLGTDVEVVSPAELRDELARTAGEIAAMYTAGAEG